MMQLDTSMERMYIQKDVQPPKPSRNNQNTKLRTMKTSDSDLYSYLNGTPSELDSYHHAMTADFWYSQNGDVVTKRQLHHIHDYSISGYPVYEDLKSSVMASTANTENGVYLVPLPASKFEPSDSGHESAPKKGLFKNLKTALFSKKNSKRTKVKQPLHLPIISLSNDRPVLNRALTVNNLRSSYSVDCLNVTENTIIWREISDGKRLTLKNKQIESSSSNNRIRHNSGPDILADVLKKNTINDGLTNESLIQRMKTQLDKTKTTEENAVSIFAHAQNGVDSMSESQSEIYFGEEVPEPVQEVQRVPFRYTKRQNKKAFPKYYRQLLPQQHQDRLANKHFEISPGSNMPLSKLKNSLSSSTSSTRSSASASSTMQTRDDSHMLSLTPLSLDTAQSQEVLDRHFNTIGSNHPRRRYLQQQTNRWGQGQEQGQGQGSPDVTRGFSESGVSIESSDSGLGSYSGSYVAKVKRTVHFNGSDEVFEYIPINSGDCKQQRSKQINGGVKSHIRKTKMATYL